MHFFNVCNVITLQGGVLAAVLRPFPLSTTVWMCSACSVHLLQAPSVRVRGKNDELQRFCFQCGKLQPLSLFKANKR
jgi:hypothetical protein